jgi:hypothetical protein
MLNSNSKIFILLKYCLYGILLGEILKISKMISQSISSHITSNALMIVLIILVFTIVIFYGYQRNLYLQIQKLATSKRFDIFLAFLSGIWASIWLGIFKYQNVIDCIISAEIYIVVITLLLLLMFFAAVSISLDKKNSVNNDVKGLLCNDKELVSIDQDLLGVAEYARKYASIIYNNGSKDNLVFGIDAPWGMGKTSLLNFIKDIWVKENSKNIVTYRFNPLSFNIDTPLDL